MNELQGHRDQHYFYTVLYAEATHADDVLPTKRADTPNRTHAAAQFMTARHSTKAIALKRMRPHLLASTPSTSKLLVQSHIVRRSTVKVVTLLSVLEHASVGRW